MDCEVGKWRWMSRRTEGAEKGAVVKNGASAFGAIQRHHGGIRPAFTFEIGVSTKLSKGSFPQVFLRKRRQTRVERPQLPFDEVMRFDFAHEVISILV